MALLADGDYKWEAYEKRLEGIRHRLQADPLPAEVLWLERSRTGQFWLETTEVDVYGQVTVKLEEDGYISKGRYAPVSYCFHFMPTMDRSTEIMRFEKERADDMPHYHDRACPKVHSLNPCEHGLEVQGFCAPLALRTAERYADTFRTPMEAKDEYNAVWRDERKALGWE